MGGCPTQIIREMRGQFEFYDNGVVKLIFTTPMILEEISNTVFELEGDEDIEIPEYLLIGGHSYSSVRLLHSNYQIDYSDGQYGSVIIVAQYL